jgi:dipeptidyl aminopeptidase/acylaminoacyl peptidase
MDMFLGHPPTGNISAQGRGTLLSQSRSCSSYAKDSASRCPFRTLAFVSDRHMQPSSLPTAVALFFVMLLSSAFLASVANCAERRPMRPSDLFRLEVITQATVSPDGESVAYVVQRPSADASRFGRLYLFGNDRADVWVSSRGGQAPRNITNGGGDASGFWMPVWSPDSKSLAMLGTRGGNIRLWVWSTISHNLDMVSEQAVNPWPYAGPRTENDTFAWVADCALLFWVSPPGQVATRFSLDSTAPAAIESAWDKAWEGHNPTSSVLDNVPASTSERPQSLLLLADVHTHQARRISSTFAWGEYSFSSIRPSPDHQSIAFLQQVDVWRPDPNSPVHELINPIYKVMLARVDGSSAVRSLVGMERPFAGSLLWSPDGTELAVVGYDKTDVNREQAFRCAIIDGICRPATDQRVEIEDFARNVLNVPPYVWYGDHDLVMQVEVSSGLRGTRGEPEWMAVDRQGHLRNFFAFAENAGEVPGYLGPGWQARELLALIKGKAWRISADGTQTQIPVSDEITSIEHPRYADFRDRTAQVFRTGRSAEDARLYILDPQTGQTRKLAKPDPRAKLLAFDPRGRTVVFTLNNSRGTHLWEGDAKGNGFHSLFDGNRFLADIEDAKLRRVDYHGLNGQKLTGWALLPFAFQEGRRYPTVVWVYPGRMFTQDVPDPRYSYTTNNSHPLNLQLLAARGYVVLLPSMPIKPYGEVDDLYWDLPTGALPAINRLIDMGIADPDRLALMGHSYGGYSTYGLITQTNRFKAAIALAGFSDLLSLYGTFDSRLRYESTAHEDPFRMWNLETAGMGIPPWKDLQRYLRNSPITYVDRVETPLLIIHGDLDHVPIQQAEEFFTALYRQGKRAEFVRYWGEDHIFTSPANIEDMWRRIYDWLDVFLKTN